MLTDWRDVLEQGNEELKKYGYEMRCEPDGDNTFCVLLYENGGWKETFGGYYEEELFQTLNEVWLYARKLANKPETVWALTTTTLSSDPDFNGKTKAYTFIDEDHALAYMRTLIKNETDEMKSMGYEVFVERDIEHSFYMTWDGGNEGFMVELNEVELQG